MFTFIFKRISSCIEIFQAAVLCTSSREHPYCNSKAAWSRVLCFGSWEPHLQQSTITWSHQGLLSGFTLRGWKKAANGKTDDGRRLEKKPAFSEILVAQDLDSGLVRFIPYLWRLNCSLDVFCFAYKNVQFLLRLKLSLKKLSFCK